MKRLTFLACLLLCMSGCATAIQTGPGPVISWHGDKNFTPDERACLQYGADKWFEQTNGIAHATIVDWDYDSNSSESIKSHSTKDRLVRWTSNTRVVQEEDRELQEACRADLEPGEDASRCEFHLLGQAYRNIHDGIGPYRSTVELRIIADRVADPLLCRSVVLHEMGHVWGIDHLDWDVNNVMYSAITRDKIATKQCLKEDDLLAFCFKNDCGNVAMKPCKPNGE